MTGFHLSIVSKIKIDNNVFNTLLFNYYFTTQSVCLTYLVQESVLLSSFLFFSFFFSIFFPIYEQYQRWFAEVEALAG
jgi:hypothetical protein